MTTDESAGSTPEPGADLEPVAGPSADAAEAPTLEPPASVAPSPAPAPGAPPSAPRGHDGRITDLALARVHLRLGSLSLARAELETLAGRDLLDEEGLVDLAEVRWRTGDLTGAGEAADAALQDGRGPLVALVIAAEAAAARGRPSEARTYANRAIDAAGGSIDVTFAGMPRASVWPADPAAPPPSPTTLFHAADPLSSGRHVPITADADGGLTIPSVAVVAAPGFWDTPADDAGADEGILDPEADFEAGRAALEAGDVTEAAHRFGLVLRLTPALAPAVLDLVLDRTERPLALVRGDAYRLVGRESEARRAFGQAARSPRGGSTATTRPVTPTSADPPAVGDPDIDDPSEGDPA
jgi:hypothetical protein